MSYRLTTNFQRRHSWADSKFRAGTVAMRAYSACLSRNVLCVMSPSSSKCEQCIRHNRQCELDSPVNQLDKLSVQENKLLDLISESETKTQRLRKQRRLLFKKMRDLGDREAQNIFELEVNKILAEKPFFKSLSEISPPPSPSQVSLGFPHRTPATPLHSG
jgi:hypothetical protein